MRTVPYRIITCCLIFLSQLNAQEVSNTSWLDLSPELSCRALGTGKATGQVGTLYLDNRSEEAIPIQQQVFFIPSNGKYQGYLARIPAGITAAPAARTEVPIIGYCTDLDKPAVPRAQAFSLPEDWYPVNDPTTRTNVANSIPVLPRQPELPFFEAGQITAIEQSKGFQVQRKTNDWQLQYPGTFRPIMGILTLDQNPLDFAGLLCALVTTLEESYQQLAAEGLIRTPFNGDQLREQQTVIQHALWIIIAQLRGKPYTRTDFEAIIDETFNALTTNANSPRTTDVQQEAGTRSLWSTFHQLIYQAQLSNKLPEEVAQFPAPLNLPNWEQADLTAPYRKPGLILPPTPLSGTPEKGGIWLPLGGGVVLGSGLTYLLLDKETIIETVTITDTIIIDPPPPPPPFDTLMVQDDMYTLDCLPPATIFPLQNDSGSGIRISAISQTGTVSVEQFGNDALIINDFGGQTSFSFLINVTDSLGNAASSTVTINLTVPDIAAVDDNFNTPYLTPLSDNVLGNDTGESLQVISFDAPTSGVTILLEADGDFSATPATDFTGTVSMEYIIQDACLQQDTATIEITVGEPNCDFTANLSSTSADCGFTNGTLNATVSPDDTYSYLWSNGDTTATVNELASGTYTLTITSNSGLCEQTFTTTIEENSIAYIGNLVSTPGTCTGGGSILLDLASPADDPLVIEWSGPDGTGTFNTPAGMTDLGESFNLLPGTYNLSIYPQSAGVACAETTSVGIADTTISLQAVDDQLSTPFETMLTGNLLLNDNGQNITLTANTPASSGTLNVIANGQFSFEPAASFTGTVNFEYTITDICGQSSTASVSITVGEPGCDFTVSLESTPSDCGLSNGSLSSSVQPADEYTYSWSTGSSDTEIQNLAPGTYALTVSSEGGLCQQVQEVIVLENPIDYILSSNATGGSCLGDGNISLELQSPQDLPLTVAVVGNGDSNTFSLSPGMIELATLLTLPAGSYTITVYPSLAGVACAQAVDINIPDVSPPLTVNDDNYSTTFQNPANGNVLNNDSGLAIELTDVNDIVGGVVNAQVNGDFIYVPFNDFTGTGSFSYQVTDGCGNTSNGTVIVNVGAPDCVFTVNFTTTPADCGFANGSISTSIEPDDSYTFDWSTGASTSDINLLPAGEYQLTVTSNSGLCSQTFIALVSELAPDYIVSSSTSPGNCTGGGNITLELSAPDNGSFGGVIAGPSTNQTIGLLSGVNQLNESLDLLPGSYNIIIYSLSAGISCNQTIELEIADNTPALTTTNDSYNTPFETPVSGNFLGNDNGLDITVSSVSAVNNGTLDYDAAGNFTFTPVAGFAGITGFTYTILDACGATANAEVIITVNAPICDFMVELTAANSVCDMPNGTVNAVVTPAGDYLYNWSTGATTSGITDLAAGTYDVTVTGNSGFCVQQASATIIDGPPLFVDSLSTAPGDCAGNGSIIMEAYAPGNGTLDVLINGPNGEDLITVNSGFTDLGDLVNLPSGVYDIVIYPTSAGLICNEETFAIVEDNTPAFIVNDDQYSTPFQTPLIRNVLSNDEGLLLEVTGIDNIAGGTVNMGTNGNFVFIPDNGATGTASFTYTATDACTELQEGLVTIDIGPSTCNFTLFLSSTDPSCGFPNGTISANANPTGDYSYSWSTGDTTQVVNTLTAGIYSVTVIDNSDGCPLSLRDTLIQSAPAYISNLEVMPADCNAGASIEFELSNNIPGIFSLIVTPPSGTQQTFENIPPGLVQLQNYLTINSGTYAVATYNQNVGMMCTDSIMTEVDPPIPSPLISLSNIMLPSGPGAMDGSFDVTFTALSAPPYTITINDQVAGQSDGSPFSWSGLPPGTYNIFATDANGCTSNVASITLTSSTALRGGWSNPGMLTLFETPEGPASTIISNGTPFFEVAILRPQHSYRFRLQELRMNTLTTSSSGGLLLGGQFVRQGFLVDTGSVNGPISRWSWANGFALLQHDRSYWFWHSTVAWRLSETDRFEIALDGYFGKQHYLQLGINWEW